MFTSSLIFNVSILSKRVIANDPHFIVKPIAMVLGFVLNFIFNFVSSFGLANSLGISIIILTVLTKLLMLPLAIKQQNSMMAMQKLQPEMEKINKKYSSKDPEVQQKKNAEIQKLYTKNKINPLGGCLPLLIQMPIFFALNYIMQQSYIYVDKIGQIYKDLGKEVLTLIDTIGKKAYVDLLTPIVEPMLPGKPLFSSVNPTLDIGLPLNLEKVLNKLSISEWKLIIEKMPQDTINAIQPILAEKHSIEYFFGINLSEVAGLTWPGIIIPVLSVITTFLSSYLMNKMSKSTDANAKTQQKIMLIAMPLMMGYFTINLTAGVGVYWITSNIFQLFQQISLNKYYHGKDGDYQSNKADKPKKISLPKIEKKKN